MAILPCVYSPGEHNPVAGRKADHQAERRPNFSFPRTLPGMWQVLFSI